MTAIPVYYRPEQNAPFQDVSPSSGKPQYVVESWLDAGLPIDVRSFPCASKTELYLAHDPSYVDAVLNCTMANGFGNRDKAVAKSLPYTSGSFLQAAWDAVVFNHPVTCSVTSGFHHAGYDRGGGFCTFNGLMVAAAKLLREEAVNKLAILDCDMHYGNGTDDIIETLKLERQVLHYTHGTDRYHSGCHPEEFVASLAGVVREFKEQGAEILFYQAGADPHVNDPLGGYLTTDQMRRRDRAVFCAARDIGLPVVWNLAGGYQVREGCTGIDYVRPVLDLHDNTMRECVAAFCGG